MDLSNDPCLLYTSDYGCHTYFGENVFINYGVNILDVCDVRVGNNVLMGPNVQLIAATHPTDPQVRLEGLECGKPVTIGDNVCLLYTSPKSGTKREFREETPF